jgi:hypothetical protein
MPAQKKRKAKEMYREKYVGWIINIVDKMSKLNMDPIDTKTVSHPKSIEVKCEGG